MSRSLAISVVGLALGVRCEEEGLVEVDGKRMARCETPGAAEVATRVTALPRPWIHPRLTEPATPGHTPDDPAVRRFWTAVVGPGAVADLLRLTAAARTGRRVRRPVHLPLLLREGLAHWDGRDVLVHPNVPTLAPTHRRRLRPALRVEYLFKFPEAAAAS
jgi:hypothetical protein